MRLEPASLRRRMLAGAIDVALPAVLGGAAAALVEWRSSDEGDSEQRMRRNAEWLARPRTTRAVAVATPVGSVLLSRTRSPGERAVGIRRVDSRAGGPEPLRNAVIRAGLSTAAGQAIRWVNGPHRERGQARYAELERRRQELRERFADDPEARERTMAELGRAYGRDCLTAMVQPVALLALPPLTALLSPRHQTLAERLAGVVVVRDRG